MAFIAQLCDDIVAELTAIGSPIATMLLPGLPEADIRKEELHLPFVFPTSLIEMYKWRNGTDSQFETGTSFFPWWTFDGLPESVERYKELAAPQDEHWDAKWFPIFSSSDVSTYGICCQDTPADDGEIVHFEYLTGSRVEFVSLEAMLQTILEAYKGGVIFLGSDNEIDVDDEAFAAIARQHNPGVKRWTE